MSDSPVSIVIPVHRDTAALRGTLACLRKFRPDWPVIVVDSDQSESAEELATICDEFHTALIFSPVAQRAFQLNLGARHVETDWIWFLHADTHPVNEQTMDAFEHTIRSGENIIGGGFERRFHPMGWFLKTSTRWADWRGNKHGLYLGDQAMFVRRDVFNQLGGFPPLEKFEDLELSRALVRHAEKTQQKLVHITPGIISSARRFEARGELPTTLRDLWWTAKHLVKAEPHSTYPATNREAKPTAILMLKSPRPGTVKTRLAKTIGEDSACAAYRQMVEHQLAQIPQDWKIHVFFAPDDAATEMSDWLSSHGLEQFTPQSNGDLGDRLTAAGKSTSGPIVFLGGDSPWMTRERLILTHELLENHQAVINPAFDGGYTMLAMREFNPHVFHDIQWSTDEVFSSTIERFKSLDWKSARLTPVSDVDTIDDWNNAQKLLKGDEQPRQS